MLAYLDFSESTSVFYDVSSVEIFMLDWCRVKKEEYNI